jgi:Tfp pilus assembly protein PilV
MFKRNLRALGFTLVEVTMATTILGLGVIGFVDAVTIGSETVDTARKQQVASQIVYAEIEHLRASPWSTVANLPSTGTITIGSTGAISGNQTCFALCNGTAGQTGNDNALIQLARGFTCSFACTMLRPTAATASTVTYVQLVYTVNWTSNTGRAYSRTTQTFLGMNGLQLSYQKS